MVSARQPAFEPFAGDRPPGGARRDIVYLAQRAAGTVVVPDTCSLLVGDTVDPQPF